MKTIKLLGIAVLLASSAQYAPIGAQESAAVKDPNSFLQGLSQRENEKEVRTARINALAMLVNAALEKIDVMSDNQENLAEKYGLPIEIDPKETSHQAEILGRLALVLRKIARGDEFKGLAAGDEHNAETYAQDALALIVPSGTGDSLSDELLRINFADSVVPVSKGELVSLQAAENIDKTRKD